MEGCSEYTEQEVADIRQGVVLHPGGLAESRCEIKISSFIKDWVFIDQVRDCQLLKNSAAQILIWFLLTYELFMYYLTTVFQL
jgi:hypothetical protein